MRERPTTHTARDVTEELRELHQIASRAHGPAARSTRLIEEHLRREERKTVQRAPARGRERPR